MGFFSSGKIKSKVVDPLAAQKTTAANYMTNLLQSGTPSIPTQQVAGMTDTEQMGQKILGDFAATGLPKEYQSGMDVINKLLNQSNDITQLPEYKAILSSVNAQTSDAVNQVLRRLQIGGMGASSPQGTAVGKQIAQGGQNMIAQLAPLAASERDRQLNATSFLGNLMNAGQQFDLNKLNAISQFGTLPRELAQAQTDAEYNKKMMQILFPYQYGSNIAGNIMGGNIDTAVTGGEPSLFAQMAPMLGSLGGSLILGKMLKPAAAAAA